jgi:hypothetical protein
MQLSKQLTNKITKWLNNYPSKQPNEQQTVCKKQPVVSKLRKKFPCWVQCFIPPYPGPDKSNPCSLLFPKPHIHFCTHCTCYTALPCYSSLFHQPVQFGKQYKSWSYSLYNTFQPSVTSTSLHLIFPQPQHNNKHCVWKPEFKNLSLKVPFCVVFFRLTYVYQIC